MARKTKAESLREAIIQQRKWIERCGGDLAGYIANYGDPGIPPVDEDGNRKVIEAKPGDVRLFSGYEPVPGRPNCFFAKHTGNGGSAIYKADYDRLVSFETEFEMRTGQKLP